MEIKSFSFYIFLLTCILHGYSQDKSVEIKINDSLSFSYTAKELFEELRERGLVNFETSGIEQVSSTNHKVFQANGDRSSSLRFDSIHKVFQAYGDQSTSLLSDSIIKVYLKEFALEKVGDDSLIFSVKTIYDLDSRVEAILGTHINEDLLYDMNSVVCLIDKGKINKNKDGTYTLLPRNLYGKLYNLCPEERYYNQPIISECTGVAIGKNLILTASHCIAEESLKNLRFVFNYRMLENNKPNLILKNDEVLIPEKIVSMDTKLDYAIIKVAGKIPDSRIAKCRQTDKIPDQQSLYVIGTPCGLPMKIDTSGVVLKNSDTYYFYAAIDAFEGNSGSPVFNRDTHMVEGILVKGENDFDIIKRVMIIPIKCRISVKCSLISDKCGGEKVLRITQINLKK